jgi:hypothetical protein
MVTHPESHRSKAVALGLGILWLAVPSAWSQTSSNTFQVTVLPPADTVMVTQTVNAVFLTMANSALFTNISVLMQTTLRTVPMLDNGAPPDQVPADNTFSADLLAPPLPVATNFPVRFILEGDDLSVTNDLGELLPGARVVQTNVQNYIAITRPANDNFTNAFKISPWGALVAASNNWATIEPAEPFHGSDPDVAASVWWSWSPALSGNVLIDTAGSSFAPILAVYTGAGLSQLKQVAVSTNDIPNQLLANVNFDASAGVTYRIAIAGFDTNGVGSIRLNVAPGARPDTQPPWVDILSPASEALLTTNVVRIVGTAKDPQPNGTGIARVFVQVNDGPVFLADGATNWTASVTLDPGASVVRAVAQDLAGNRSLPFVIVIRYVSPINDDFANAILLPDLAGTVMAVNTLATKEPGEPPHAGNEGGHSVWYAFRTTAPGQLRLTTQGSELDTLLAVYTGASVAELTLVGSNDDAVPGSGYSQLSLDLLAGQGYAIVVDGFGGESGTLKLGYTFTTSLSYFSLNLLPVLGGSITPDAGLYLAGSTQLVTALPARDFQFVGWQGSRNTTENPITLVMTQNYTLSATFKVKSYTDDFEAGVLGPNLAWSADGSAPWVVQSDFASTGRSAARSGPIGDASKSVLVLTERLMAGTGSFDLRVSSELGWDGLEFWLNGVMQQRWSGQLPWQNYQFSVTDGNNRLEWRYVKDANFSGGLDAAFIDNLYLPLADSSLAAQLSIAPLSLDPGQIQVQVRGVPGRSYAIEASDNLQSWQPVYTGSSPSGSFYWLDGSPTNRAARFYRAVLQ